jgi:serine/threonine protein kinase
MSQQPTINIQRHEVEHSNSQALSPHPPAKPKKQILLSDHEKTTYGNRCPNGYKKINLLGKGGIALVWLGEDLKTGEKVAMKQFPK